MDLGGEVLVGELRSTVAGDDLAERKMGWSCLSRLRRDGGRSAIEPILMKKTSLGGLGLSVCPKTC